MYTNMKRKLEEPDLKVT